MARALASHQCGLGSTSAREFPRVFLQILSPLLKPNISKFQFDQDRGSAGNQQRLIWLPGL